MAERTGEEKTASDSEREKVMLKGCCPPQRRIGEISSFLLSLLLFFIFYKPHSDG